MNKTELVHHLSFQSDLSQTGARRALDCMIDAITKSLKKGRSVSLSGFGTFSLVQRQARTGRNPRTGLPIQIQASKTVRFKPSKELKETFDR